MSCADSPVRQDSCYRGCTRGRVFSQRSHNRRELAVAVGCEQASLCDSGKSRSVQTLQMALSKCPALSRELGPSFQTTAFHRGNWLCLWSRIPRGQTDSPRQGGKSHSQHLSAAELQ